MGRFDGQVVMITGCATGIGSATACRFAKEGACIVGIDILAEPLRRTLADCESLGVKTLCIVRDVREPEGARKAVEQALHMFGHLDVLVCSAGIYTGSPLVDVALSAWQSTIDTNLTGTFLYNQAVTPVMIGQKSGSIVNISSMAGKTSWDASAQYSASKSGVIGLTRSVAMELAPHGATA
ncbi:MAG: SDR family NAD(P)-dependent oxidoreductase, partial [Rectinemataceae bacterium]